LYLLLDISSVSRLSLLHSPTRRLEVHEDNRREVVITNCATCNVARDRAEITGAVYRYGSAADHFDYEDGVRSASGDQRRADPSGYLADVGQV
jgi:hypothetical protein